MKPDLETVLLYKNTNYILHSTGIYYFCVEALKVCFAKELG